MDVLQWLNVLVDSANKAFSFEGELGCTKALEHDIELLEGAKPSQNRYAEDHSYIKIKSGDRLKICLVRVSRNQTAHGRGHMCLTKRSLAKCVYVSISGA